MSDHKNKPALDEQAFGKLLEASYVIQEHNRRMRDLEAIMTAERLRDQESVSQAAPRSKPEAEGTARNNGDYTLTLAEIVEAQRQIQARRLDLDHALAVVAESVARITHANGAGIGILDEKIVRYRAGAGGAALPVGCGVPLKSAICAASVRTGQVIRSEDVNTEVLFDPEPCRQRGIRSLIAVPIYQDGGIVGGLELYFDRVHGYAEQDIHTCQLMAGLVTEALGRDADTALKESMAAERSSMLATIQKLQPNAPASAREESVAPGAVKEPAAPKISCWNCAAAMFANEHFCGNCGSPRVRGAEPPRFREQPSQPPPTQEEIHAASEFARLGESFPEYIKADGDEDSLHESVSVPGFEESGDLTSPSFAANAYADVSPSFSAPVEKRTDQRVDEQIEQQGEEVESESTALVKPQEDHEDLVWTSAARAKEFLESLSDDGTSSAFGRFWHSRRGDFYLAFALVLVACVIMWGFWSNSQTAASASGTAAAAASHRKPAPDANLSAFDKLLISMGVADPPDAPEYRGNPDVQVWVDLHTALYYCPGSDLYGKTPKGRLTTQHEAQLDQFEPAYRKACD